MADPKERLAKMAAEAADPADREWAKTKLAGLGGESAAPAASAPSPGLTPERLAQLQAKSAGFKRDIAAIQAEPEESPVAAGIRGAATGLSDLADASSFGLYRRGRDKVLGAVAPDTLKTITDSENEFHAAPGGNAMRTLAGAIGYGVGPAGLVGKAGGAIAKAAGGGILANALGGAASGAATAGAEAAIAGKDPLEEAKYGGLAGGALGAAGGLAGRILGGATARAAESELAGLKEGVQNKTRVGKFVPREADIRAELATDPKLRASIKSAPTEALPQAQAKLKDIADNELNPFYDRLEATGRDGVPAATALNNLKAVKAGFNKYAEKGQVAVVDDLINSLEDDAVKNGGTIPARTLRETATAFQSQGHANLPMFGQIPLTKEAKQDIGNALRGAVADHVESIASDPAIGKAYRAGFEAANKRVSTWYTIRDILEEKAARLKGDAAPMADIVKNVAHGISHPFMAALPFVEPSADALNRRVLAPAVSSAAGQALAPAARAAKSALPVTGSALARRILHPDEEEQQ